MPLYIAQSGDLEGCHACLTDSQRKDRATQLLIKYKSGALVTQHKILSSSQGLEVKAEESHLRSRLQLKSIQRILWSLLGLSVGDTF